MGDAHAVAVLPPGAFGQVTDARHRHWLSRGRLSFERPEAETLQQVLSVLGTPRPADGFAALRRWGQSGERFDRWLAAADPVHFETRLRHLVVRAFRPGEIAAGELGEIFAELQASLGDGDGIGFESVGAYGYVKSDEAFATATVSPAVADGRLPDEFMPAGSEARKFHRLQGEVQMLLHDMEINRQRAASGRPAVNALWFWGGGRAPEHGRHSLPALFADDPLFRGFWLSCGHPANPWNPDFERCASDAGGCLVIVAPESTASGAALQAGACLEGLRELLVRGTVARLSLVFRDGLTIRMRRRDLARFWRRTSALLKEAAGDE